MASIKHSVTATGVNNGDKQVSVNAWNADHVFTGTPNTIFGFDENGNAFEIAQSASKSVKDFGAVGDGVTNDSVAMRTAFQYACLTGVSLYVPDGVFMVDCVDASLVRTFFMTVVGSNRFEMYGNGASSIIKFRDGAIDARFREMFIVRPSSPMETISFRNLFIDMNARGSEAEWLAAGGGFAFEQAHGFRVDPTALVRIVNFNNVTIKDPAADGFNYAAATEGMCDYYLVDNCKVIDRTRVRSDIQFSRLPQNALITDFVGDKIESENTQLPTTKKNIQLDGVKVNRIDFIGLNPPTGEEANKIIQQKAGLIELYMTGVTASEGHNLDSILVRADASCELGVGRTSFNRHNNLSKNSRFSGTRFIHEYDAGTNAVAKLFPFAATGNIVDTVYDGCEFIIDSPDSAIVPVGPAFEPTAGIAVAEIANFRYTLQNCKFDKRFATSVLASRCGTVVLKNNKYAGKNWAIQYTPGATFGLDLTADGGDFSDVTGHTLACLWLDADQVTTKAYLRLRNEWVGVTTALLHNTSSTPSPARTAAQVSSNRKVLMAATPVAALAGDIVEITQPAAAGIDSYRCVTSSSTAAVWKTRTTLGA